MEACFTACLSCGHIANRMDYECELCQSTNVEHVSDEEAQKIEWEIIAEGYPEDAWVH